MYLVGIVNQMEGSVSNVEVCNFAFTGQFDKLRQSILSDKTLACKTDQVRMGDRSKTSFVFAGVSL